MADQELNARIEDTLSKMTLEEKCALLSGDTPFTTLAIPRLGIPALTFSDGPHGMRHQGEGANHLGIGGSDPATCFPTAVTVANSWDPSLGERLGEALGEEAATMGVNCVLGPGLNIKRSPLCGRNFEYFSEDPYLAGKMAAGYVRGIQSQGVSACPKHFAVNSQETRRQASDSVVDERTMRELYLTGFEIAVKESAPKLIMTSYNLVNGTYANENEYLLKDILRDEWGYEGSVVTDWGGSNDHVAGVRAGSTFEMPGPVPDAVLELAAAVRSGKISQADIDDRVREALGLILSTQPAVDAARGTSFDVDAHHQLAREIAA
ncbi:MAG: glycoside hydrolase family 3 protein, partial [Atopobiaceae bacterium]|nr:glycoside hydrolase family 3 protein [Atopobiaceae bacterium]